MKRIIMCVTACLTAVVLSAQGTVTTRSYRFSDFTDKVTKVVMSGNEFVDSPLRQEVVSRWTASAFEFCSSQEFESLKRSPEYYFLFTAEGKFKGEEEPGIVFLTLVKGGTEGADDLNKLTEVISLPLGTTGMGTGREIVFLPALVEAVQTFALEAMSSEKAAYQRADWFNGRYAHDGKIKRIYLSRDDLAPQVTEKDLEKYVDEDFILCDEDEADAVFSDGTYNTPVGYVVAPEGAGYCYKMLLEADTCTLYYIRRHKLGKRAGAGFLPEDLRRIAKGR